MKKAVLIFLWVALCALPGCKKEEAINPMHTGELYLDHATDIAVALQGLQTPANHLWKGAGWWISGNTFEAILDYAKNSGADVSVMCSQIYEANQFYAGAGFRNRSYDDCAWWALAFIKAYDRYGDARYLATAQDIFAYMQVGGWDNVCGGGMNWQNIERYKNAITNELFILLAARLAGRQTDVVQKVYYLDWSVKGWNWLYQSGMINSDHLVNDGLDKNCNNNGETTWTYNQGVILAALKELYMLTSDPQYLQIARQLATGSMSRLSDANRILTEPCRDNCNEDGQQFKGIYIKYLGELNTVIKDSTIKQYIVRNAAAAFTNAQNTQHLYDPSWQGPYTQSTVSSTTSALNLMNAATIQMRQ